MVWGRQQKTPFIVNVAPSNSCLLVHSQLLFSFFPFPLLPSLSSSLLSFLPPSPLPLSHFSPLPFSPSPLLCFSLFALLPFSYSPLPPLSPSSLLHFFSPSLLPFIPSTHTQQDQSNPFLIGTRRPSFRREHDEPRSLNEFRFK